MAPGRGYGEFGTGEAHSGAHAAEGGCGRSESQDFQQLVLGCNKDGMDFLRKGHYKQAFEQLKYAEAMVIAKTGEDEPTNLLAVTSNNLGCYYKKVGKLHAALSYLRKALKIEVSLQTDDVTVAGTHLNICAILSKLEKHDKAVQHATCALELIGARVHAASEGVTQDEYSVLAIAYHNVAVERDYLHQWDQAAEAYEKGYQVAKKCLGDQHPLTQTLGKNVEKSQHYARGAAPASASSAPRGRSKAAQPHAWASGGGPPPMLPEILSARGRLAKDEEPLPISARRNVQQEAEDWVQAQEHSTSWRPPPATASPPPQPQPQMVMQPQQVTPPPPPVPPPLPNQASLGGAPTPHLQPQLRSAPRGGASPHSEEATRHEYRSAEAAWAHPPSILESATQEARALHGAADPPPLVMLGREHRAPAPPDQIQKARSGRLHDDVSQDMPLVMDGQFRQPAPPQRPPPRGSRPQPASQRLRAQRAEREFSRAGAERVCEQVRDASTKAVQTQQTRKSAAEKIQKHWRLHRKNRDQGQHRKELERVCATRIQARWRAFFVRRSKHNKFAVVIQKWARGFLVRNRMAKKRAAAEIQRIVRGFLSRRRLRELNKAALLIQRNQRGKSERNFVERHKVEVANARDLLQRQARGYNARKVAKERRHAKRLEQTRIDAACRIQGLSRGRVARRRVLEMRRDLEEEAQQHAAATKLQALARRIDATKKVDAVRQEKVGRMHVAATVIRKFWLRFLYRKRFLEMRGEFQLHTSSIVTIQRYVRGYLVRLRLWRSAIRAEEEQWAVVEIQRCWRGYVGRLRWELAYEAEWSREAAAMRLQRYVRGWLARTRVLRLRKRLARAEFQKARLRFKAAQKIQALVRGRRARRGIEALRRRTRAAAVRVQKVWRGHTLRRARWEQLVARRLVQLQAVARGFLVRNRRFHMLARVIMIQRNYKHWLRFVPLAERRRRLNNRRLRALPGDT